MDNVKVIAFYLPQFHPIKENNEWWGKGFTEWTNVSRATPLFKGHYQPKIPADLGFYDLRLNEVREEQAKMAKDAGVYGFCYWHYWFGNGRRLLERPFTEVLNSGKPDFPFCLGWANESWKSKVWNASDSFSSKILIEQLYPGEKDNENHFYTLIKAFKDKRYITIDKRPLFVIYRPEDFIKIDEFIDQWNSLARTNGIEKGFHFTAHTWSFNNYKTLLSKGFNSITVNPISRFILLRKKQKNIYKEKLDKVLRYLINNKKFEIIEYKNARKYFVIKEEDSIDNVFPPIIPNWDHSPRSGKHGVILHNSKPHYFEKNVIDALDCLKNKPSEMKVAFLKSWNEWAEGNYIEPDLKFGHKYLNILRKHLL